MAVGKAVEAESLVAAAAVMAVATKVQAVAVAAAQARRKARNPLSPFRELRTGRAMPCRMALVVAEQPSSPQDSPSLDGHQEEEREIKYTEHRKSKLMLSTRSCNLCDIGRVYGSGYPGSPGVGVANRGFPFIFWPVVWGPGFGYGPGYLHDDGEVRTDFS